ncbi:MAG: hypothetical protein Q8R69_14865, partial [Telluria sp.]|nr:hypothetical protein [Telluria sp.]
MDDPFRVPGRHLRAKRHRAPERGTQQGSGDSDITVIEYDNRSNSWVPPKAPKDINGLVRYDPSIQREGIVSSITTPGNRKSTVQFDLAGRIATVKDAEGRATSLRYSPRGQLLAFTRDGVTH